MHTTKKLTLSKETLRNLRPAELHAVAGAGISKSDLIMWMIGYSLEYCTGPFMCGTPTEGCGSAGCDTNPGAGCTVTTSA